MRIGSLFSGYGGLELGVQQAIGGTVAWHSDIDPGPSKILAHHWPTVPNLGDITKVDWADTERVDVITGGFPCQDVSHAGRRQGLIRDGAGKTRSGLWGEMLRAINHHRPALVVAENVRGLLSAAADSDMEPCPWCVGGTAPGEHPLRALGAVLADLADIGYDAAWSGLRAADVGAPHGRFRVFILAWPATDTASDGRHEGRPEPARLVGRPDAPVSRHANVTLLPTPTAADAGASGGAVGSANVTLTDATVRGRGLLPTPAVADVQGGRKTRSGARNGELLLNGIAATQTFGDYAPAITRWEHALGRPAPSPTEPTGKAGAHRLSPRFVEWLMGLPAGHVTDVPDLSRNAQLKALGNGVVPQQAAAALTWLLDVRTAALEGVAA